MTSNSGAGGSVAIASTSSTVTRQSIRTIRRHDSSLGQTSYDNSDSPCSVDQAPEGVIRVGCEYQADIPPVLTDAQKERYLKERRCDAMRAWVPVDHLPDTTLDEFISIARERHDYSREQAYAMLMWHKFSVEKSLADLPNFVPATPDWTTEDESLFEQAFTFYGKNFAKIRSMMPDKTVKDLIQHYYCWKKRCGIPSLLDKGEQKKKVGGDQSDEDLDISSASDTDVERIPQSGVDMSSSLVHGTCSHCTTASYKLHTTPKGTLCSSCYDYYIQTSTRLPPLPPKNSAKTPATGGVMRKRKCPNGIYLDSRDLKVLAEGPSHVKAFMKEYEKKVEKLKKEVQLDKQAQGDLRQSLSQLPPSTSLRPTDVPVKYSNRWSQEDVLLCRLAIRTYGKDYNAIAEIVATKTEFQVRNFLDTYKGADIDQSLSEYLKEKRFRGEMPLSEKKNLPEVQYLETKTSLQLSGSSSNTIRPARFIPTRAASSSSGQQ